MREEIGGLKKTIHQNWKLSYGGRVTERNPARQRVEYHAFRKP